MPTQLLVLLRSASARPSLPPQLQRALAGLKKLLPVLLSGVYPPPNVKTILTPEQYVDCRAGLSDDKIRSLTPLINKKVGTGPASPAATTPKRGP